MYQKIMVPLDGSELAECVLPDVKAFIQGFSTVDISLVRVVKHDKPYHGEDPVYMELAKKREQEATSDAKDYLSKIAEQLKHDGASIHQEVLLGRVTDSLADYTLKNDIDIIIIATHGYSGVTRWVRGSVADKVLRSANVPVLMVRAPGTKGGI